MTVSDILIGTWEGKTQIYIHDNSKEYRDYSPGEFTWVFDNNGQANSIYVLYEDTDTLAVYEYDYTWEIDDEGRLVMQNFAHTELLEIWNIVELSYQLELENIDGMNGKILVKQ